MSNNYYSDEQIMLWARHGLTEHRDGRLCPRHAAEARAEARAAASARKKARKAKAPKGPKQEAAGNVTDQPDTPERHWHDVLSVEHWINHAHSGAVVRLPQG